MQVGGSYSAIKDIADQATKDLGFKVEMQTADHSALLNRLVTQPQTIDIADIEYFFQHHLIKRGTLQPMEVKKIKLWDKNVALEKLMKHLGLYGNDDTQKTPNIAIQVQIVNLAGQVLYNQKAAYGSGNINTANLPRGLYILTITSSDRKYKFIRKFNKG